MTSILYVGELLQSYMLVNYFNLICEVLFVMLNNITIQYGRPVNSTRLCFVESLAQVVTWCCQVRRTRATSSEVLGLRADHSVCVRSVGNKIEVVDMTLDLP